MAAEIIEHDDISWRKCEDQASLDVGLETFPVDRAAEDTERIDAIGTQSSNEGEDAPVTMRGLAD